MVDNSNNNQGNPVPGTSVPPSRAPAAPKTLKSINCPSCGSPIPLRALGQSVMVACGNCGTQLDISQPQIKIIQKFEGLKKRFRIALGTRGTLRGQMYEVVGAMTRVDDGYTWEEYLLFNPYVGFRWLIHDAGHWNFCEPIKDVKALGMEGSSLTYRDSRYSLFHRGTAVVDVVIGEFYWRVASGDRAATSDYICPPFALSKEKSDGEVTWSLLTYLEPEEVTAAFHITSPERAFVAYNQPNPGMQAFKSISKIMGIALALCLLVQIGTAIHDRSAETSLGIIDPSQTAQSDEKVFGPITLASSRSLNELRAQVFGLDNSWVELNCSLVNTQTGASYDFDNAFEHYSGYDSDGHWSEGSDNHTALLREVPAGEYNLVVNTSTGNNYNQAIAQPINLVWRHDVTPWQNFWLVFFGILLYPGFLFYRRFSFEKQRWQQSEFNPYSSDDDDD
jgi:hypothetical protein